VARCMSQNLVAERIYPEAFCGMTESPAGSKPSGDGALRSQITLLILEIRVPHGAHNLWAGLRALWPPTSRSHELSSSF